MRCFTNTLPYNVRLFFGLLCSILYGRLVLIIGLHGQSQFIVYSLPEVEVPTTFISLGGPIDNRIISMLKFVSNFSATACILPLPLTYSLIFLRHLNFNTGIFRVWNELDRHLDNGLFMVCSIINPIFKFKLY